MVPKHELIIDAAGAVRCEEVHEIQNRVEHIRPERRFSAPPRRPGETARVSGGEELREEEGERVGEKRVGCRVRVLEFLDEAGVAGGANNIAAGGGGDVDGVIALVAEVHLRTAVRHRNAA